MTITNNRKSSLSKRILKNLSTPIGFADVGAGGPLKDPWNLLPIEHVNKCDFDAEVIRGGEQLPVCVSNVSGERPFYIGIDPRASSLHQVIPDFAKRFSNQPTLLSDETIQVRCITLDQHFADQIDTIDLMDINTEGHDYQVLQGSRELLDKSFPKCIKIEFEFLEVYSEQGWFSDIDIFLRQCQFELADIDIGYLRPANADSVSHKGEPAWGKAFYVPTSAYWLERQESTPPDVFVDDCLKAIALYTILGMPGRAIDILDILALHSNMELSEKNSIRLEIVKVYKFSRIENLLGRVSHFIRRLLTM